MKVLLVTGGGPGGITSHVHCLACCLCPIAEVAVCITGKSDLDLTRLLEKDGIRYYRCEAKSGHDVRVVTGLRRAIKDFKPDVLHFHGIPLLGALYVKFFTKIPRVCSIHTPTGKDVAWDRNILNHAMMPCYWLSVSTPTWKGFKEAYPNAKGEVFFNPLRMVATGRAAGNAQTTNFIVGMVGRAADQKDWPSFHKVAALVGERVKGVEFLNAGEEKVCNGREAIAKMDLFMMTSKHEQLPTTVLECFALGTPICGFIPDGGTTDILQFSTGPVRDAFIKERSCEKLADIVLDLLAHPEKRAALVADGRQILENHFDAEKLCKGQLMEVYRKVKVKMRGEDER